MKKLLALLLCLAMVFTFAACGGSDSEEPAGDEPATEEPAAEEPAADDTVYELKYSVEGSKGMRMMNQWEEWEKRIEEQSGGRIKFTNYYDSTLLDNTAEVAQLTAGIADIGNIHKYASDGFVMFEKWKGFTMGTPNEGQIEIAKKLYEEFPELQKECEILKSLAFAFDGGAYQLLTVNKPVEKVEDLKGMTIWCEADFNDFFAGCGATTVNTPWSEVYSSLQKNMYDGMFIAVETLQTNNFAEVCHYVTMVNLNYLAAPGDFMNWDSYNKLPDDLKALFDDPENIAFIEERMDKSGEESDAAVIEWAKSEAGTEFIELSDEEYQKFVDILNASKKGTAEAWDAQGLPGTDLLNRMIELSNEY